MATLFRMHKSPYYWASFYYSQDGETRRVRRSTGKRNRRDAEKAAETLEQSYLKAHGVDDQTSREILQYVRQAGELALLGDLNADTAQTLISKILEAATGDRIQSWTVASWCEHWKKAKKPVVKASTYAFYRTSISCFLESLGSRKNAKLQTLSARDLIHFRDELRERDLVGKTINHRLKGVRSCLEGAVKEGILQRNPAGNVENLPETDSLRREPFTAKEVKTLLSASPSEDWRGLILLSVLTGLRLSDAAKLKWGNVDLANEVITITPAKTDRKKQVLRIPVHPELLEFLENHPISDKIDAPVFPSLANLSVGARNGLSRNFGKIMDTAGISRLGSCISDDGSSQTRFSRGFHSLRHTFNSLMANADVSQELRRKLTGHSSDKMNDIYTHTDLQTLKKAVAKLPPMSK